MGYTHYFSPVVPSEYLASKALQIIDVAESQGIIIKGPMGEGNPIIAPDKIALNGDRSQNQDYESFVIDDDHIKFCKTGRRPYDAVCCAILIAFMTAPGHENYYPRELFASDGTLVDWINLGGVSLYEQAIMPLLYPEACQLRDLLNQDGHILDMPEQSMFQHCSPAVQQACEEACGL